jgi:hypothetical protein
MEINAFRILKMGTPGSLNKIISSEQINKFETIGLCMNSNAGILRD